MSEHTHEWFVSIHFSGRDVEADCQTCDDNLAAHEIDSRLKQRDDLLAACKSALPLLPNSIARDRVDDAIAAAEKE